MASHFAEFDAFNVPPEFRPLGAWAYVGLSILFSIPVIGWIFLIVFSFSDANINRRNYARSYFAGLLIVVILIAVLTLTGVLGETATAISNNRWPSYLGFLPWA